MPSADSPAAAPLVEALGISKRYAGVAALSGVELTLRPGEVHGLVGANGAGKSTLIKCLAGLVKPDEGTIRVRGEDVQISTPRDADRLGLAFIHQELNLVPHFDTVDNMLLGRRRSTRFGLVDRGRSRAEPEAVAQRLGITFPLDRRVDELSVAQRWMVSIGRALMGDVLMIAMDEPTASLSEHETQRLFEVVGELSAAGVAVLYVSHRLDEVLQVCDQVSVFRDGHLTRRVSRGELDRSGLVREIVGRDLQPTEPSLEVGEEVPGTPVLELRGLTRWPAVKDVSLVVRPGEVVGLGGLVGAGRTELARLVFGADQAEDGEVLLDGVRVRLRSVGDAVRQGIGLVPEERRSEGLLLDRSVSFNINIADTRPLRFVPWLPLTSPRRARARAQQLVQRLQVKTRDVDQPVGTLSGGNQQKVLIARWLTKPLRVLILDEPSRGVDIGARGEIHRIARELAQEGTAVLAISSDVEELVAMCDRVVVMAEGRVTGEVEGAALTEDAVIALSYAQIGLSNSRTNPSGGDS